jgi:hypothetical protein
MRGPFAASPLASDVTTTVSVADQCCAKGAASRLRRRLNCSATGKYRDVDCDTAFATPIPAQTLAFNHPEPTVAKRVVSATRHLLSIRRFIDG